jgi:hypothetical protein
VEATNGYSKSARVTSDISKPPGNLFKKLYTSQGVLKKILCVSNANESLRKNL